MRVHWLQHVPFEGLGGIADWLRERGAEVRATRLHESARLPAPRDFDLLVVMGGPMSANDEARLPWLAAEKRLIAGALDAGRTVLGVCLGAQLLAAALGAEVRRNPEREIGWFPVEPAPGATTSPWAPLFAAPFEALHWHGETFALPPGAVHLARSAACQHQAFAVGERVLGLQFHLEMTPDAARALAASCPDDLAPGRFVQSEREMLREPGRFARANAHLRRVLDRLAAGVRGAPA